MAGSHGTARRLDGASGVAITRIKITELTQYLFHPRQFYLSKCRTNPLISATINQRVGQGLGAPVARLFMPGKCSHHLQGCVPGIAGHIDIRIGIDQYHQTCQQHIVFIQPRFFAVLYNW